MKHYLLPILPFVLCTILLLSSHNFGYFVLTNVIAQALLFLFAANIPAYRTQRMSYVDIAWPMGLAMIGVGVLVMAEGNAIRIYLIAALYLFMGLRMGLGALFMLKKGFLDKELPRYQYQRRRWEKNGIQHRSMIMQIEIFMQAAANMSFLSIPALLVAYNPQADIHFLEILGLIIWLGAYIFESVADKQKRDFGLQMKAEGKRKQVCNLGLWKYTRHPNYFGEWMVWNGLIVMAIPSLFYFYEKEPLWMWALIGFALLYISRIMYITLVYATGAKPSEYYSAQKRPGYKAYQATTNIFFPGKPKKISEEIESQKTVA